MTAKCLFVFSNVPSALLRHFTQAISKTASHFTSYSLHFFIYSLSFLSPRSSSRFLLYMFVKTDESLLKSQAEDQTRSCKLLLTKHNSVFVFLLANSELAEVKAARSWASLHWHCFKRALPLSEKWRGQVSTGNAAYALSPTTLSLSLSAFFCQGLSSPYNILATEVLFE